MSSAMNSTLLKNNPTFARACFPEPYFSQIVPHDIRFGNFLLAMIVINAVMAAVASCSNAVVIYTISRTPSLQTPSNILILGLAISDLSFGVFVQPPYCLYKFSEFRRDIDSFCYLGNIVLYTAASLQLVSFLILTAITADRFLAVHLHLRYQDIITTKRVAIALGFIWLLAPCYAFFVVTFMDQMETMLTIVCLFIMFFSLNIYFIVRVSLVIRRHSLQIQSQQSAQQQMDALRFRKSAKAMFWVQGTFLLCYFPYACTVGPFMASQERSVYVMRAAFIISEIILTMNGVLNPIIYCWRIEGMRNAAVTLLWKMCGPQTVN